MRLVTTAVAFIGAANAYTITPVVQRPAMRASHILMEDTPVPMDPTWGDAREGKPFGEADRGEDGLRVVGGVRAGVEAFQPYGITDGTVVQYIETEDEPWHAWCRSTVSVSKDLLSAADDKTVPFLGAEAALGDATRAAKDAKAVEAAIATALKGGARPGCPAIKDAEKVVKAFAGGDDAAVTKAKPKAPKVGVQGKGWDDMSRGVAKTHDNSVA